MELIGDSQLMYYYQYYWHLQDSEMINWIYVVIEDFYFGEETWVHNLDSKLFHTVDLSISYYKLVRNI